MIVDFISPNSIASADLTTSILLKFTGVELTTVEHAIIQREFSRYKPKVRTAKSKSSLSKKLWVAT